MKYVTIIDIAKELNISKSTVSRALSGDGQNVSKETMRLITETAERMGYRRNDLAVKLRKQSSRNIGIVIPEVTTTFFMKFVNLVQRTLNWMGYQVIITLSDESPEQERKNLEMLQACRVEGILISACHDKENLNCYRRIIGQDIPLIFFDRTVGAIDASSVSMDDYIMSFFMVEELIRGGRKKILHLQGPDFIGNSHARLQGYRDALAKFRIAYDKQYVVQGGLDFPDGELAMTQFLSRKLPFDAVFGFTEMSTLGAKSFLQKLHYQIPGEIAICCMSGTQLCTLVHPTITSVEQPVAEMATTACRLLMEKIDNPAKPSEHIVLRGEMIPREST